MCSCFTKAVIKPLGDSALLVELGHEISPVIHQKVQVLAQLVQSHPFAGFIESVPAYTSLTIHYNPKVVHYSFMINQKITPFQKVSSHLHMLLDQIDDKQVLAGRRVEIPVVYGGEYGPDLEFVASYHNMATEEVIHLHTKNECLVYMVGFAPGFPFLGGMDVRIATPRRNNPRPAIVPGSVGIAGKQTGIYSIETPGGWQIIGRTPLALFRPDLYPPVLLQAGDKIKFFPISPEEFDVYKEMSR